jgi:hypothetical protein
MPLEWRRVLRSEAKAMSSVVDDFVTAALRGSRKLMTRPEITASNWSTSPRAFWLSCQRSATGSTQSWSALVATR